MIITNKLNLPQPIVDAVANDPYTKGDADISCTSLIDSPRIYALKNKHGCDLVEDVSERIWSLLGQAVHNILERAADSSQIVEKRLYMQCNGWTLSGQFDHMVLGDKLSDYKVTSVWSVIYGNDKWEPQLNVLAELCRANGYAVSGLQIVTFLRDWQRFKAKFDKNYPPFQVHTINIPLWSRDEAQKYINERIRMHRDAGTHLPLCSDNDMWKKQDKYAVIKKGRVKALRVLDSMDEACQWCVDHRIGETDDDNGYVLYKGTSIEKRPGEYTRCENYCSVSDYCEQRKTR